MEEVERNEKNADYTDEKKHDKTVSNEEGGQKKGFEGFGGAFGNTQFDYGQVSEMLKMFGSSGGVNTYLQENLIRVILPTILPKLIEERLQKDLGNVIRPDGRLDRKELIKIIRPHVPPDKQAKLSLIESMLEG